MTTVVSSNGDAYSSARSQIATSTQAQLAKITDNAATAEKARQMFRADPSLRREDVATELGMSARWAGTRKAEVRAERGKGRLAANGGGPASGVSPPRLPTPRAIDRKRTASVRPRYGRAPWYLVAVVVAAIGMVATVTFTISYSHIRHLAFESGLAGHAGMYPLGIDGLVIACTGFLMVDKLNGRRGPWLARLGVVLGLAGTIAGNVLAVPQHPVAMVGAGIMPAALAVVVHLGFRFLGREP